jgi:cytoskeletal protein CcmA (bactofilin family)
MIGRSISIVGEVKGEEDLLIQGRVEGSVDLRNQSVTVGEGGRVKADITGRIVAVEGEVEGNLQAEEQVILRSSARVKGDITAPRVVLEDGASFRGLVDMGDREQKGKSITGEPASLEKKGSEPAKTTTADAGKSAPGSTKVSGGTGKDSPLTAETTGS